MPARAFISYAHADDRVLERLHKHFAMLQREGLLQAWSDHAIRPGEKLGDVISNELEQSDLFLALVSPDYLASNYCYDKEFQRAVELAAEGRIKIVPIIVEPCDWLSSPLSEFLALPRDGKPISEWTNANNAFLDVVNGLRRLLESTPPHAVVGAEPTAAADREAPRRIRLKRDFDVIERAEFADQTFDAIRNYFQAASIELAEASDDLRTRFQEMSPTAFTCTIVNRASRPPREVHITVHNSRRQGALGDINYVYQARADPNTSNGSIRVEADEYNLYLVTDSWMGGRTDGAKSSPKQAAEWLWNQFAERAGVQYE